MPPTSRWRSSGCRSRYGLSPRRYETQFARHTARCCGANCRLSTVNYKHERERFTTPLPKEVNQRTQQRNAMSSIQYFKSQQTEVVADLRGCFPTLAAVTG